MYWTFGIAICIELVPLLCAYNYADKPMLEDLANEGLYDQTYVCETTPGVKSYSGYVHLPSRLLDDDQGRDSYNVSMFFWFFEARHNASNAPLAIYLAGGPGESSIYTAANGESGPCYTNADSNSTSINPWSFNNHVNMLYIDQPNMAGFSYDSLINGTLNLIDGTITPMSASSDFQPDPVTLSGVFPSQNSNHTVRTTAFGARTLWSFMQTWLAE